jgi:hypothetical protein
VEDGTLQALFPPLRSPLSTSSSRSASAKYFANDIILIFSVFVAEETFPAAPEVEHF